MPPVKIKHSILCSVVVVCVCFLQVVPTRAAEITAQALESVVRIFCFGRNKQNGIAFQDVSLPSGAHLYQYQGSTGTGFVINQNGYIITNNHVVAPSDDPLSAEHPNFVFVLQKTGNKYLLHEATVKRQDPNSDVAIIQCSALHANPLELSFFPPHDSDDVYSAGFPGIADVGAQDVDRDVKIKREVLNAILNNLKAEFQQTHGREPSEEELRESVQPYLGMIEDASAEFGDFLHALVSHIPQNANASPGYWDISDMLDENPLWKNYLEPTVTKGNIEKVTKKPGYLGSSHPNIEVIQHSCNIRHGNSGGPLLNGGSQVLGVVGRGWGREESVTWATAISEVKKTLDERNIEYVAAHWHPIPPVALIAGISTAVAVAIVALMFGLTNLHRKPQESLTKLIDALRHRGVVTITPRRSIPLAPASGNWQLVGRSPKGKPFQLVLKGSMFEHNAGRLVVGRAHDLCHLEINDETVSRQHAHIRLSSSGFTVADRNSSNGTAVNGQFGRRPFEEMPFKLGDTLTLGEVKLDFRQA
jgi:hypothetical protein